MITLIPGTTTTYRLKDCSGISLKLHSNSVLTGCFCGGDDDTSDDDDDDVVGPGSDDDDDDGGCCG
jgi:hypothetical protein